MAAALRSVATKAATSMRLRMVDPRFARMFSAPKLGIPPGLKFLESHEWIKVESGTETATIGITDHAQQELGDVVFAELPDVGALVTKGKNFMVVESVKACSDVYSPVSGEVVAINEEVQASPDLVNKSPFERGWLIKVQMSNTSELEDLLDASKYEDHVKSSAH